jgi:hypothetical protein
MLYSEFVSILKERVSLLSYERSLRLAMKISKRLFFDYQAFFEIYQWGNPDLLMDAITVCEQPVNSTMDLALTKELIDKINKVIPDTEEFGEYLGSYALNASTVVVEMLQFTLDKSAARIFDICSLYIDTIHFKIAEEMNLGNEDTSKYPLMAQAQEFLIDLTK